MRRKEKMKERMKARITGFFRKLWREESGASYIVEVVVVIILVMALAAILTPALKNFVSKISEILNTQTTTESTVDYDTGIVDGE
jgi:type II secretory pathway pseudopilin PulG